MRAIVSRAEPTVEIEVCELFERKLIFSDSAVSSVTDDGVSLPPLISSDFCWIWSACLSSAWPQACAIASNQVPPPLLLFCCVIGVAAIIESWVL